MKTYNIFTVNYPKIKGHESAFIKFMVAEYPCYTNGRDTIEAHDENDLMWFAKEFFKKLFK